MSEKKHLSISRINMHIRCPQQEYFRYVLGIKERPKSALFTGQRAHDALASYYASGKNSEHGFVLGAFEAAFDAQMERDREGNFHEADVEWDINKGKMKDAGIAALRSHLKDLSPAIRPIAVEWGIRLPIPDTDYDFLGYVDIVETDAIRDHKFTGKMKSQGEADQSIQLTAYAWALDKPDVSLEVSTFGGKSARIASKRTHSQKEFFVKRILTPIANDIARCEETGNFPCHTEGWHCSINWCGFWNQCAGKGA